MNVNAKTFGWVEFSQGRARFAGGTRGWDERGYETFSVEVGGISYYGEIRRSFLSNDNDFNIEIVSFGYGDPIYAGAPIEVGISKPFTSHEIKAIQDLTLELVHAGLAFENRPSFLEEHSDARFMGEVSFRRGWALESTGTGDVIPTQYASMEVAS